MKRVIPFALFALMLLLVSCTTVSPAAFDSPVSSTEAPVVAPTETPATLATSDVSPLPPPAETVNVGPFAPAFKLDPVTADSTEATGQGPIGLTLAIVDSTAGAIILGTGQADAAGNFRIPLNEAPRKGHIIGLTVDVPAEQLASEQFMRALYEARGPGYRIVPQVVIIYDGVEVP